MQLIKYSGSSLDTSEIYIASKMTSVVKVARKGERKDFGQFVENHAMSTVMEYQDLVKFWEL